MKQQSGTQQQQKKSKHGRWDWSREHQSSRTRRMSGQFRALVCGHEESLQIGTLREMKAEVNTEQGMDAVNGEQRKNRSRALPRENDEQKDAEAKTKLLGCTGKNILDGNLEEKTKSSAGSGQHHEQNGSSVPTKSSVGW
jgi:hypothetical protein